MLLPDRSGRFAALLAVAGLIAAACSSLRRRNDGTKRSGAIGVGLVRGIASASGSAAAAAALSVTFIPKQINNPYFDAAKEGADKAASELGGTVTQVGPSAATEAQASYIQDATTQRRQRHRDLGE